MRVTANIADDVGLRIADDRPIHHEFRLRNSTDRPIRLVNAVVTTPCCSSIGPIPKSIPAHGEAGVPVEFRPGFQSGRKRLQFVAATDREDCRRIEMSLTADLRPSWEVAPIGEPSLRVVVGSPSIHSYRIITRQKDAGGLPPPSGLDVGAPFTARFVGEPAERRLPGEIVEAERTIQVESPAIQEPGVASADLRLTWTGGTSHTHPIRWEITPLVRVAPLTLVVRSGESAHRASVTIHSVDRPIRILGVSGSVLAKPVEPTRDSALVHRLDLTIDAARGREDGSEVEVMTDHPAQSRLKLKVLIVPRGSEVAS